MAYFRPLHIEVTGGSVNSIVKRLRKGGLRSYDFHRITDRKASRNVFVEMLGGKEISITRLK